ncbi:MAG: hypothetical protein AB7L13_21730 [Acidimicrobiia bacterium]
MDLFDQINDALAESWTTKETTHREHDDVLVVVRPEPSSTDGAVDVLVTVRARSNTDRLDGRTLTITGEHGVSRRGELNHRGQVRFDAIEPGSWRARIEAGARLRAVGSTQGTGSSPASHGAPFLRLQRRLGAAAAAGVRDVRSRATTADGALTVELEETDEGRLVATISSTDPRAGNRMVDLVWQFVAPRRVEERHHLVTPLAPRRNESSARYDLGPAADVHELQVLSVDWVDAENVDDADVSATLSLTPYGSAQRAWRWMLDRPDCPPDLRAIVERFLE